MSVGIDWRSIGQLFSPSDLNNDKSTARTQFNADFVTFVSNVLGRPASSVRSVLVVNLRVDVVVLAATAATKEENNRVYGGKLDAGVGELSDGGK